MSVNIAALFFSGVLSAIVLDAHAIWHMFLANPWMFALVPAVLLLTYVSRRLWVSVRHNRRHPRY